MSLKGSDREDLLCMLADEQNTTAPITVQIGFIAPRSTTVINAGLLIKNAPPSALRRVMTWHAKRSADDPLVTISVQDGGVLIY